VTRGTSRERIVELSREIVEREGVEALTIRRVAEAVGRTQPAVYQHFASKDELLAELVVSGFLLLLQSLERARSGKRRALSAIVAAYVAFGTQRPRLYSVMFVDPPAVAFAAGTKTPAPAHAAFGLIARAIAADSGRDPLKLETVTETAWSALHGLVSLAITGRLRPGDALLRTREKLLVTAIEAMATSALPRARAAARER
jgi:AcrR family transcriptional regulator